ncbi:MAG: hypothetical protein HKN14_04150 [Marinicaulis sp.]|nr:hypothetical protein [Marinicaulis sp.]NNL88421.1 hypothetical protein [Marinicaulis sp.]
MKAQRNYTKGKTNPLARRRARNWAAGLLAAVAIAAPLFLTIDASKNARDSQFDILNARFEGHALESEKALIKRIENNEQSLFIFVHAGRRPWSWRRK